MGHHGHFSAHQASVTRKLGIATAANAAIVIAELAIGYWSGSLALVGDALHNLTDTLALLLALFAVRLERKPATAAKSYGYHRAGILVAFINAGALIGFTVFLLTEAWERLQHPQPVHAGAMLIMATIALLVNSGTAVSLHRESRSDVNVKSAVIHMVSDAASSAGIVIAAIVIHFTGWFGVDALISALIALLILWSSYGVLRETVNLLLEGTPTGIDPEVVSASLAAVDGIEGVHHLHIWALGPSRPALSCHVMVGDVPMRTTARLLEEINALLLRDYGITHTTVQFEYASCSVDDPYCLPYSVERPRDRRR